MWKKAIVCMLVVTLSIALNGCFGSFRATKGVYNFNRTVHHQKWVREGLFLGMVIIPVYGLATLLDALILNAVEFWTGRNPVAKAGDQHRIDGDDGSYAISTLRTDGSFDVVAVEANGTEHHFRVEKTGDKIRLLDANRMLLASQPMNFPAAPVTVLAANGVALLR